MAYTWKDFERDTAKKNFRRMTPEERSELLASLTAKDRRVLLESLPMEERLHVLDLLPEEEIQKFLADRNAPRPANQPRRKK
jgi:Mg/Co/Ni transporter MgtE